MVMYRVKQFYLAITSKVEEEDKKFINLYLDKNELDLFNKLPIHEQTHSLRTAKSVKEECLKQNLDDKKLIKAALLHDIGKIQNNLNVIDKSIIVLLDKITKGKAKKLSNIKKIDTYYNHGEKGYNTLKKYISDKKILKLVKEHHNASIIDDKELQILRECDGKN